MRKATLVAIGISFALAAPANAKKKYDIPCEKVFITGTQTHEIAWALDGTGLKNNLYKHTCLEPVARPEDAQAILDIEIDPTVAASLDARIASRERALEDGAYAVTCSSNINGAECSDSAGNISVVSCDARGCSSYYGPNPLVAVSNLIGDALVAWAGKSAAWAYLRDAKTHELQWQYTGVGEWHDDIPQYSECHRRRKGWGTSFGPYSVICAAPKKLLD
jgi:hypothetical protein